MNTLFPGRFLLFLFKPIVADKIDQFFCFNIQTKPNKQMGNGFTRTRHKYNKKIALFFKVSSDFLIELEEKEKTRIIALTEEEYIKLLQVINNAALPQETDEFSYTDGVHTINHKKRKQKATK